MRSRHTARRCFELGAGRAPPRVARRARSSSSVAPYSDCSVSDTYEHTGSSGAASSSFWKRCNRARSGPSAMTPRSALCPSIAIAQRLVPVGLERGERVDDVLRRARDRARRARDRRGSRGAEHPNRSTASPIPRRRAYRVAAAAGESVRSVRPARCGPSSYARTSRHDGRRRARGGRNPSPKCRADPRSSRSGRRGV